MVGTIGASALLIAVATEVWGSETEEEIVLRPNGIVRAAY